MQNIYSTISNHDNLKSTIISKTDLVKIFIRWQQKATTINYDARMDIGHDTANNISMEILNLVYFHFSRNFFFFLENKHCVP